MRGARARGLAGAVAATLLAACASGSASPPQAAATLTPAAPRAWLALSAPPPRDAVLEVDVTEVHNPARVPVTIDVGLIAEGGDGSVHRVMQVALFPADQPGRFSARADMALARAAPTGGRLPQQVRAQLTLRVPEPGASEAAQPLRVRVAARWTEPPRRP